MTSANHRSTSRTRQRPLQRIDEICDVFEDRYLADESPLIEEYIDEVEREDQPRLFRELLDLEVEYLGKRGAKPDLGKYLLRFPQFAEQVKDASLNDLSWGQVGDLSDSLEKTFDQGDGLLTRRDQTLDLSEPVDDTLRLSESIEDQTTTIAGYELLGEIARGGMGIVYKARQVDANRVVALKMILSGTLAGEKEVARFKIEAESAASLDHPNIVPIYDVGESKGIHYFSMGFIDGPSLKDYRKQHAIGPKRSADIVKTVAEAITHAHSKGIVHRDLKPANILIDKEGNPRVTDFGLSKILEGQTDLTGTGQLLGTPAYMSPEQASGKTSEVGPLSDVYSLGAMLYELVSGRTPFQSESVIGMLEQVCWENPDALQSHSPTADTDIASICMKCLEKESGHRYQSAAALADDLARYLEGSPISARPTPKVQKVFRWCKRKPLVAGLVALSLGTFAVFGSTTAYFAVTSNANSEIASVERERNNISLSIAQNAVEQMVAQAKLLEDIPKTETQRKEFLTKATEFYQGFLEQRPDDAELQHQSAVLHRSMGDIFRLLGEVSPANEAYEQSIELLENLVQAQPSDATHKEQLRESLLWLGVLLKPVEFERAVEATDRAFTIQSQLSLASPETISNRYGLARVLYNRGLLRSERGDLETAESDCERAIDGFQEVLPKLDADQKRECRLSLSHALNNFGNLLKSSGRPEEAKSRVQEAISLLADISESRKERCELAVYRNNLSNLFASNGELDDAIRINEEAIALLEQLVQEYPRYPDLKNSLGNALNSHGSLAGRGEQLDDAAEFFRKAETAFRELLDEHPEHVVYSNRLGTSKYNRAVVTYMQESYQETIETLGATLLLHRRAFESNPKNGEFSANLRNDYLLLLKSQRAIGQLSELKKTAARCLVELPSDDGLRQQVMKLVDAAVKD